MVPPMSFQFTSSPLPSILQGAFTVSLNFHAIPDGRSLLLSFPPSPVEGSLRSQMATVLSPHITLSILSFPRAAAPLLFSSSHFLSSLRLESPPLNSRPIRSSLSPRFLSPLLSLPNPPSPVQQHLPSLFLVWSILFIFYVYNHF